MSEVVHVCLTREQFEDSARGKPEPVRSDLLACARVREDGRLCWSTRTLAEIRLRHSPAGLGDAVAVVAQPIARVIDAVLGTDIQHCGGCMNRRAALNELVPITNKSLARNPSNDHTE